MSEPGPRRESTLLELLAALCDGALTDAQAAQLAEMLSRDRESRRLYMHYLDLHAELRDRFEFGAATGCGNSRPATRAEGTRNRFEFGAATTVRRRWLYAVATLAALAATVVAAILTPWAGTGEGGSAATPGPSPRWIEPPPVAAITQVEAVRWAPGSPPLDEGTELYPGTLKIVAGEVRIEFYCGASVLLEGPAEFQLIGDSRGHLARGKMAAIVPEEAVGFVVSAPGVAVVDFGTEFGLNVGQGGQSEIHVFDGEVEASLLGDDGTTLRSARLVTGESVAIDARKAEIAKVAGRKGEFIRVKPVKPGPLAITPDYVRTVLHARPVGYWRFEAIEDGRIANSAGDGLAATVIGDLELRGKGPNRVALFRSTESGEHLLVEQPFEQLAGGDYTIEFWVKPHVVKGAALVGLMDCDPNLVDLREEKCLTLVRLRQKSGKLMHPPGAAHVAYRATGGGRDTNLFSRAACSPGRWHHLAVVKQRDQLSLFHNGKRIRTVSVDPGPERQPCRLFAGRIPGDWIPKQRFKGELDELAVYPYALSGKEIRQHHALVQPGTEKSRTAK
jgi:hypothetical protein